MNKTLSIGIFTCNTIFLPLHSHSGSRVFKCCNWNLLICCTWWRGTKLLREWSETGWHFNVHCRHSCRFCLYAVWHFDWNVWNRNAEQALRAECKHRLICLGYVFWCSWLSIFKNWPQVFLPLEFQFYVQSQVFLHLIFILNCFLFLFAQTEAFSISNSAGDKLQNPNILRISISIQLVVLFPLTFYSLWFFTFKTIFLPNAFKQYAILRCSQQIRLNGLLADRSPSSSTKASRYMCHFHSPLFNLCSRTKQNMNKNTWANTANIYIKPKREGNIAHSRVFVF